MNAHYAASIMAGMSTTPLFGKTDREGGAVAGTQIRAFLQDRLHLELHIKLHIVSSGKVPSFLGGFIKPHRTYISNESLDRMIRSASK